MNTEPSDAANRVDHTVRSVALRRQCDALTIEFADGAELLTVGVVATEGDSVILSIDCTQAPKLRMAKETVVTTTDLCDDAARYHRSISTSAV